MTQSGGWSDASGVDVAAINGDLRVGEPTVDVAIHVPENLDPAPERNLSIASMVDGFIDAKRIFGGAGVQLRLTAARTGHLDPRHLAFHSTDISREPPPSRLVHFYVERSRVPSLITDAAKEAFEAVISAESDADRTVHLVALADVYMSFHEDVDERTWQLRTISTGGLSFPGYVHGDTMPRHLRGAITVTNLGREDSWKTIAHELGHKLMNVSHEYREIDPQHEVRSDEGLMLYGKGIEIPSGEEGRWHRERLHRSPFVHRERPDGTREWNEDYRDGGFYHDPIYRGVSIEF